MEDWDADFSPCNFATTHFPADHETEDPFATPHLVVGCNFPFSAGFQGKMLVLVSGKTGSSFWFQFWALEQGVGVPKGPRRAKNTMH